MHMAGFNPQSQQASGRRPTPETAQLLGLSNCYVIFTQATNIIFVISMTGPPKQN